MPLKNNFYLFNLQSISRPLPTLRPCIYLLGTTADLKAKTFYLPKALQIWWAWLPKPLESYGSLSHKLPLTSHSRDVGRTRLNSESHDNSLGLTICGYRQVKNLPAVWESWVQSLGQKDPLKKGTATHSSILAWRIPWTEEPGGLQSIKSQRVGHDWVTQQQQTGPCSNATSTKGWSWGTVSLVSPGGCVMRLCEWWMGGYQLWFHFLSPLLWEVALGLQVNMAYCMCVCISPYSYPKTCWNDGKIGLFLHIVECILSEPKR